VSIHNKSYIIRMNKILRLLDKYIVLRIGSYIVSLYLVMIYGLLCMCRKSVCFVVFVIMVCGFLWNYYNGVWFTVYILQWCIVLVYYVCTKLCLVCCVCSVMLYICCVYAAIVYGLLCMYNNGVWLVLYVQQLYDILGMCNKCV